MGANPKARRRTTMLMNLASIVERADEQVLPSVYSFIAVSLNATPTQLGTLTLCRALVQALSCPISGILGDKYDRTHIVAVGCLLWGVMTALIGLSQSMGQAMVSCAVNGLGLALVIPCVSSLIADYYPSELRGRAFGFMSLVSAVGGMAGGFFATNIGGYRPFGIDGWRFSFHLVAGISLITSVLVSYYATDPRSKAPLPFRLPLGPGTHAWQPVPVKDGVDAEGQHVSPADSSKSPPRSRGGLQWTARAAAVWGDVQTVLRIRTFQIIVLQGIVGMIPWNAMVFITWWLQLLGFSNFAASSLNAIFGLGCALGAFAGGMIGDAMARWHTGSGRILTCQLSVLVAIPLAFLLFKGLPTAAAAAGNVDDLAVTYAAVFVLFGLMISWCGVNNSAMFADVVPEQLRSTIYAFDRTFEGAIGASAMPLVGVVAERVFTFKGMAAGGQAVGVDTAQDHANAAALGSSLLVCMVVPWVLCLLFYTGLHWSFPRDKRSAKTVVLARSPSDLKALVTR